MRSQAILLLCAAAVACTPRLNGTCRSNADCHTGEFCSSEGLCLNPANAANSDGGDSTATVNVVSPAPGSIEKGTFHVSAQASSAIAIQSVTFVLANSANGAGVGQLDVTTPVAGAWSGDLTLSAGAFGGLADLRAVVHRAGLPDVVSSPVALTIDQNAPTITSTWNASQWFALDGGFSVTATVADDLSGVAAADLVLPDGGVVSGTIGASGTSASFPMQASAVGTPGALANVSFSLSATDRAGNRGQAPAASSIQVDDQPPTVSVPTFDPLVWHTGPFTVDATINDGVGSGPGSASLLVNGTFVPGQPDAGGVFTMQADLSSALPATEGPVALQVVGTDAVGNQADGGFTISVDNIPPAVSAPAIDTVFDVVDGAGKGWFAGPTVAPAGGAISVSAAVSDTHLDTAPGNQPAAVVGGTRYPGTPAAVAGRWTFSIPRSVGLDASAPVMVSFDALDLAGNHPSAPPSLALEFDDATAASFPPAIAADTAWHARSGSIPIDVTFGTAPRSGFVSVLLTVTGQPDVTCTSSTALAWSCPLPAAYAAVGAEGTLAFAVAAKSLVGVTASSSGSRNIDDAPPVISASAAVPYPAGTAWGHDGSHFTLRDSTLLYTFNAWDCGGGLSTTASPSFSPSLRTGIATVSSSGTTTACTNGVNATVYNVAMSGDLGSAAPGAFANVDNVLTVGAGVQDVFGHAASGTKGVNATRRFWQTANIGANSLAVGPLRVIVGSANAIWALNSADGGTVWGFTAPVGQTILAGPVVGGPSGNPVAFFAYSGDSPSTVSGLFTSNGAGLTNCSLFEPAVSVPGNCTGATGVSTDPTQQGNFRAVALALATDGSLVFSQSLFRHGFNNVAGQDCASSKYAFGTMTTAGACSQGFVQNTNTQSYIKQMAVGRGSQAFLEERLVDVFALPPTESPNMDEQTGIGVAPVSGAACGGIVLTDNAGADAPLCSAGRYNFSAGVLTQLWPGTMGALITAPSLDRFLNASQGFTISGGVLAFNLPASPAWAVDGSATPVLYTTSGGAISSVFANFMGTTGAGVAAWALPGVPGAISDVVMDNSGILYVASSGQVSAMITDSPGLATGLSWPIRSRDACRSSNLEYACPY